MRRPRKTLFFTLPPPHYDSHSPSRSPNNPINTLITQAGERFAAEGGQLATNVQIYQETSLREGRNFAESLRAIFKSEVISASKEEEDVKEEPKEQMEEEVATREVQSSLPPPPSLLPSFFCTCVWM